MAVGEQRIDKWLFFARVVKSRSLAQKLVQSGAVRLNREKTVNAARLVRPGDALTISLPGGIRVLKVVAPGERRGPASEAATLYEDLSPPRVEAPKETVDGYVPSDHSPSKRERRALDKLRRRDFE